MKRNRFAMQADDDDDDVVLSDDEIEELEKDAAAFAGTRYGGRSTTPLQNNVPAMLAKLEELRLLDASGEPLAWAETLIVDSDEPLKVPDVEDDLARETIIYNQTLANVEKALALCKATGLKFQRPDDYYADMLKTDDHMLKLKDHLLAEKKRKDDRTKLVKERQMKKFAKKVQVETHLRRQKLKAEDMAVVKEWRKNQKRGANSETEFPEELLDPKNKKRKELLEANGPVQVRGLTKSKKRAGKDAKYGRGGPKRFKRDNDSESAADMGGFSKRKNAAGTGPKASSSRSGPSSFPSRPEKKGFGQRSPKSPARRPGKTARRGGK
jgi:rRNA-processing protein EBP2